MSHRFDVKFLRETEAAHFVVILDTGEQAWLPKSQIEDIDCKPGEKIGEITISDWIARKKGLA